MNCAEPAIQRLLGDLIAHDPVLATGLGLEAGAERLPSWSASAIRRRTDCLHGHERELTGLLAADDEGAALDAFVGLQIVRRQLREFELRRVQHRHPAAYLDVLYGLYPLLVRDFGGPGERVEALAGRLRAVPGFLEEARAGLQPGLAEPALRAGVDGAIDLLDLVGPGVREFAAAQGLAHALDAPSEAACAALEGFIAWLEAELGPSAEPGGGAGRAVIDDILRWEHVLDEPAESLLAYGFEVLQETREAMRELAAAMGHPDVESAVAAAQSDTPPRDGLLDAYREAVTAARGFVAAHDIVSLPVDDELEVVATPRFLRSLTPFAAYDPPGPFAARQLGVYYVTMPDEGLGETDLAIALRSHPRSSLATTGVHEVYPGHHLQLVRANRAPTLARRIAAILNGGSLLVEGWAFYCEELMERQGFLDDPESRLMRLNDQIWRACRVVIDLGLHLGTMDLAGAVNYLAAEAHMNRAEAEAECRRYLEEPGQAMSYLLGKREVLRLASQWLASRGGTLRAFHDELLTWGSLPPAVIAWGMGFGPRPAAARVTA